jgi:hypothetical protein
VDEHAPDFNTGTNEMVVSRRVYTDGFSWAGKDSGDKPRRSLFFGCSGC